MIKKLSLLFSLMVLLSSTAAFSETEGEELYMYGSVTAVSATQISIQTYNIETDADETHQFEITPETTVGSEAKVSDIKVGDDIDIYYVEKDGKKVATTLVLFQPETGEVVE